MNQQLAKKVAEVIVEKWTPETHKLNSELVYQRLIAKGVEVPDNEMDEILENFKKAGLIAGPGYMNSDAVKRHGAMLITAVNLELFEQLDFN